MKRGALREICDCGGEVVEHKGERHVYLRDFGWIPDSYRPKHAFSHADGAFIEMIGPPAGYVPAHRMESSTRSVVRER